MGRELQSGIQPRNSTPNRRIFIGVAIGVALFHLAIFVTSCVAMLAQAAAVENDFAQEAIEGHVGYILVSCLALLRGYALVAAGYLLVLYPLVLWWSRRRKRPFGTWGAAWRTAMLATACLGLLLFRLMALRPYFVNTWLPEWDFQIVPGGPSLLKDILLFGTLNGLPLLALGAVIWFWGKRAAAFAREFRLPRLRPVRTAALVAVIAMLWVAPRALRARLADPPPRPNIILIASDSLRPDHLSCNGYGRETSPYIDALAARSVNFQNCMTPIGSTLESMVGLLSSQYPHTHGVRQMFPDRATVDHVNATAPKLPEILAAAGYETAVIGDWCGAIFNEVPMGFDDVQVSQFDSFRIWLSQAVYLSHPVIPLYFDNEFGYWLFPKLQSFAHYLRPEVITDRTIEKLGERADPERPFFYTVFTGCNHFAYHAPYPYYQKWTDPEYKGPNKFQVHFDPAAFATDPEWDAAYAELSATEKQHIIDLYDGCVSRFDDCVGKIVDELEGKGLLENTIVIVTSDHGEDLFEPGTTLTHGISFNGGSQGNRIPCIMHVPGAEPTQIGDLVRNIDLAPTLLTLCGLAPEPRFEGSDLAPLIGAGESAASPSLDLAFYGETGYPFARRRLADAETLSVPPLDTLTFVDDTFDYHIVLRPEYAEPLNLAKERCLIARDWKLVFTPGTDGPIHRLYHLSEDPHCQADASARYPEIAAKMQYHLWRWITDGEEASASTILDAPLPGAAAIPAAYRDIRWPAPAETAAR